MSMMMMMIRMITMMMMTMMASGDQHEPMDFYHHFSHGSLL